MNKQYFKILDTDKNYYSYDGILLDPEYVFQVKDLQGKWHIFMINIYYTTLYSCMIREIYTGPRKKRETYYEYKLIEKEIEGIIYKAYATTIKAVRYNTVENGRLQLKGNFSLEYDLKEEDYAICIDGRYYSYEEFGRKLETYEGWHVSYQIHDSASLCVSEDTYLLPVHISLSSILDEVDEIKELCPDTTHPVFTKLMQPILDKVALYIDMNPSKGNEMIDSIIQHLSINDGDVFHQLLDMYDERYIEE